MVIGRPGRYVSAAEASSLILGFTIVNDVSVPDWQLRGQQWTPGKNFDRTLPVGPVTDDSLDWRNLHLQTMLNGETVQDARTADMIFDVPTVIEFISSWTRLEAGDLICTGTPNGVGVARTPPHFMRDGDVIEVTIEGIGRRSNSVEAAAPDHATGRWASLAAQERALQDSGQKGRS